jgi:hypothetical protein
MADEAGFVRRGGAGERAKGSRYTPLQRAALSKHARHGSSDRQPLAHLLFHLPANGREARPRRRCRCETVVTRSSLRRWATAALVELFTAWIGPAASAKSRPPSGETIGPGTVPSGETIGPGTMLSRVRVGGPGGPVEAFVLRVDLGDPRVHPGLIYPRALSAVRTVSAMAAAAGALPASTATSSTSAPAMLPSARSSPEGS